MRFPFFSTFSLKLVIFYFFDNNHLNGYEVWYVVVLIWISVMVTDIEYLFTCLLAICLLWRNAHSSPLPNVFCCCVVLGVIYIFGILIPYQISDLQIFSLILWTVFFLIVSFSAQKFQFWWNPTYLLPLVACVLGIICKKMLPNPRPQRFTCTQSLKSFL